MCGDVVMEGYWRNEEANAASLAGGWLRTGDIGRFDASPQSAPLGVAHLTGVCPRACGVENRVYRGARCLSRIRSERPVCIIATNFAWRSMRSFRSPFDETSSSPSGRTRSLDEAEPASAKNPGRSFATGVSASITLINSAGIGWRSAESY